MSASANRSCSVGGIALSRRLPWLLTADLCSSVARQPPEYYDVRGSSLNSGENSNITLKGLQTVVATCATASSSSSAAAASTAIATETRASYRKRIIARSFRHTSQQETKRNSAHHHPPLPSRIITIIVIPRPPPTVDRTTTKHHKKISIKAEPRRKSIRTSHHPPTHTYTHMEQ